jgi:hypothetical protein
MKNIRIYIALALILVVVVLAQGGVGAWANKLQADPKAVAPAPEEVGSRPQGTVNGDPEVPVYVPVNPTGECALLATYCVESTQTSLVVEAITELPIGIGIPEGKNVIVTRMIQVSNSDGSTNVSTEDIKFILDPALVTGELVSYWNGTAWVEISIKDGVYLIPKETPIPLYIAVFTNSK